MAILKEDTTIGGINVLDKINELSKIASSTSPGLMSSEDKIKLDSFTYKFGVENGIPYIESI